MNFKQCLNRSVAVANNQKLKCLGYGDIKLETNDNMADNKALKECVTCLEGKMSAQPYPASEACRASQPLELVHSDVCGPMQKCSFGGAKYFVTFTDDHSRMTFGYMMRNKSEDKDSNCDTSNSLLFYEFDNNDNNNIDCSDNNAIISQNNIVNDFLLNSSPSVPNSSSNHSNVELCTDEKQNSLDGSNDSFVYSGDADEIFRDCVEDKTETQSTTLPERDAHYECVMSSPDVPVGGEGIPASVGNVSQRPVRSTRCNMPSRYRDYDFDFLLMVHGASPLDEPQTYEEATTCTESDEWQAAMKEEFDSLLANKVWRLVDRPTDKHVVKCKWVYKRKHDSSGKYDKYKARLVAKCFTQTNGIDYCETFSPVVWHSTLRLLFSLANEYDLQIDHIDINTAFLNGELKETIYIEQPPGFGVGDDRVCLLLKGIYGLKQASRIWNQKVHTLLSNNGYSQSKCKPCVYIKKYNNNNLIMVALYVDDFYVFYSGKNDLLPLLVYGTPLDVDYK
ncbi:hypothetical protein evm_013983 [Chilo suppressalis]|nr:hypothetical protein evm_013983 [Chilo suppressalis]